MYSMHAISLSPVALKPDADKEPGSESCATISARSVPVELPHLWESIATSLEMA